MMVFVKYEIDGIKWDACQKMETYRDENRTEKNLCEAKLMAEGWRLSILSCFSGVSGGYPPIKTKQSHLVSHLSWPALLGKTILLRENQQPSQLSNLLPPGSAQWHLLRESPDRFDKDKCFLCRWHGPRCRPTQTSRRAPCRDLSPPTAWGLRS